MKYLGSKRRIAKYILPIMLSEARSKDICAWVEPFVGGGNLIDKVPAIFRRVGADVNPHAIAALIAIRDHVGELPDSLSEEDYTGLKQQPASPISSWLRFVGSFGGKFDAGYARRKGSDASTFIGEAKRNAEKQSPLLQGVELMRADYKAFSDLEGCLIYCDPPYEGTTGYKTAPFNHSEFWDWCRRMGANNLVYVSEYKAPADFVCVWEGTQNLGFDSKRTTAKVRTEKLFRLEPTYTNIIDLL